MKYNSCFVPIMSVSLFFLANTAHANKVEDEFTICAAAALETQLPNHTKFHIDLSELESIGAARSPIRVNTVLDLTLTGKTSGKELGSAVCVLDSSGSVVSSVFESA